MTTHGAVRRLNAAVAPAGGVARFFSDNGFVAGLAHDVWPAIERFDADLAALDLEFRLSVSACYSPSGAYGARPDVCPIGVLLGADGGELGSGLNVCNIPVGDDGYVQSYLSSKASDVVSQIRKITLGLRDFANEEWCALYYSSSHQWDYWATHALPRDSLPHSADVDVALLVAATSATGVDFTGNEIERRRLRLPARLRGGGVRSHVETTAAAFCGAVNQAVPRFIDRTDDAGEFVAGFFPSLASVLGAGSFDHGSEATRYATYLASGYASATELATAWAALRAEAPEGVADETCSLFYGAEGARGSQRELTSVVEKQRFDDLGSAIGALPRADEADLYRRVAWCSVDKNSAVWVTSIPTRHLRAGPMEFREICAAYFGAPSPVATRLENQAIYSGAGFQRAVCDKFGLKLASLNLDGRFNRFHDEVKFAIANSLDILGVGYSAEVHGVFTPVIPPAAQADARRFMQRGREGAQRGQRQGLVPDFKIELERLVDGASTTAALAELKMLHAGRTASNPIGGCTYSTRGNGTHCVLTGHRRAVHTRAGKIQGERVNDARRIDARFCGTQPGDDGPVLDRLRSFGPIVGLVVGHFGEWNDGLERLVSLACDDAAPRMRALFGARSERDSRGRCAWLFRREVAWAVLNANAKLKIERAEFVGWDARTARARHAEEARREHARRQTCAWASAAYERRSDSAHDQSRPFWARG